MSLTRAPWRWHTSLWLGSDQHMGHLIPLRRELPMTITHFSYLAKAVLKHRVDWLTLDNLLSGPSTASPLAFPSSSEPQICYSGVLRESVLTGRGSTCSAEPRSDSTPSPLICPFPLPDSDRAGDPPLFGMCHPSAFFAGMTGSCSTGLSPACIPWCSLLSIASLSSVIRD